MWRVSGCVYLPLIWLSACGRGGAHCILPFSSLLSFPFSHPLWLDTAGLLWAWASLMAGWSVGSGGERAVQRQPFGFLQCSKSHLGGGDKVREMMQDGELPLSPTATTLTQTVVSCNAYLQTMLAICHGSFSITPGLTVSGNHTRRALVISMKVWPGCCVELLFCSVVIHALTWLQIPLFHWNFSS